MKQLKKTKAVSMLMLAFIASINLNAQTWTGATNGDFGTDSNWSGGLPTTTSTVVIPSVVNNPVVAETTTLTVSTFSINAGATLNVKGSLTANGSVATYTGGNIVIDGGKLSVRRNLNLGVAGNPSLVTINSGVFNPKTNLIVGEKGPAVVDINGGELSVDQSDTGQKVFIGNYYSSGIVNLNGGFLKLAPKLVASDALAIVDKPLSPNASGYLNINGGTLVFTNDQRDFVKSYVEANKIRTVEGKKIVATYESTTNLTSVVAVPSNLGVETQNIANVFAVYPNPSNGIVNIDAKNNTSGSLNVSIYNLSGQQILVKELKSNNSGTYSLDATDKLGSGSYLVNIKSDASSQTSKIIVK